jgi:hypothetical protein
VDVFNLNPIGMSDPLNTQISLILPHVTFSVPVLLVSISQEVVEHDMVGGKVTKFINLV